MTVTRKPITGESTKETVKTIACGNARCSGATVVTTLVCYLHTAHEAAGAAGTRHSPRPLFSKGASFMHNSGAISAAGMCIYVRCHSRGSSHMIAAVAIECARFE